MHPLSISSLYIMTCLPARAIKSSFETAFRAHMFEGWHSAITNVFWGSAASKSQTTGDWQM